MNRSFPSVQSFIKIGCHADIRRFFRFYKDSCHADIPNVESFIKIGCHAGIPSDESFLKIGCHFGIWNGVSFFIRLDCVVLLTSETKMFKPYRYRVQSNSKLGPSLKATDRRVPHQAKSENNKAIQKVLYCA